MSTDKPLVDDPGWIQHFDAAHDFAAQQWQREADFYGPPTVKLLKRTSDSAAAELDFNNLPPLLTLAQTASIIGKTVPAVKSMLYRSELPATRVGKRGRRILRDELFKQYRIGVKRGKKQG